MCPVPMAPEEGQRPSPGLMFYGILDIISRYVVGWIVAH